MSVENIKDCKKDFKVAVVILNYNSWKLTIDLIRQLENIDNIKSENIIVVDNRSTDDSLKQLEILNRKYNYKLLVATSNCGYAAGNNIGLRYAYSKGYDYALVTNNDVLIKDNMIIDKLISGFEYADQIAIVSPRIFDINGKEMSRKLCKPRFIDTTFNNILFRIKNSGLYLKTVDEWQYSYAPQGCCMLLDLEKVAEVDYMDENTFLYGEEYILAERLMRKNYRCVYLMNANVIHNHSTVVKNNINRNQQLKIQQESSKYIRKQYYEYNNMQLWFAEVFDDFWNCIFEIIRSIRQTFRR